MFKKIKNKITSKRIRNPEINITNAMKDLYSEDYKTVMKEIADTKKWKDIPRSWVQKSNIVKMVKLPKAIYKFNAIPIRILMSLFTDQQQIIVNS